VSSAPYDVIVAGYGPVGATAASLLGLRGVRTLVLEREDGVYRLPRAGTCDDEVMRIWQEIGVAQELLPQLLPQTLVEFLDGSGRPFLALRRAAGGFGYGYPALLLLYQPLVEETLRARVADLPAVEVRLEHDLTGVDQTEDGVVVRAVDRRRNEAVELRGRYLLACDGGRSTVRELFGIRLAGRTFQQWLVVDAAVLDPLRFPTNFQFVCDPRRPAITYPMALSHQRWQFLLEPGETAAEMERDETAESLLEPWVRGEQIEIVRRAVYTYHARIAERWRVGRVFLAGDAAHLTPPFAGQGMSSGIRDAANLAWKLALVLGGHAGETILGSYERERRPHVERMTRLALAIGRVLQTQSRSAAAARDGGFRLFTRLPGSEFVTSGGVKPAARLPAGSLVADRRRRRGAGTLFIQPNVVAGGETVLLDDVLGHGFAAIGMGRDPRWLADTAPELWEAAATRFVRVVPAGNEPPEPDGTTIVDVDGKLESWFRRRRADTVVLRPDHFVFGVYGRGDTAELARAQLRRALGDGGVAPAAARPRRRAETVSPEAHVFTTEDGVRLRLLRYRRGPRGPVVLVHGLGVSSRIFSLDTVETNLLEFLSGHGYDVWLLDFRASIDLPASLTQFSADDVARYDHPAAVAEVLRLSGADSIQVVAHCFGSTTFTMAMLAGLAGVRSAVCSQVAAHVVAPHLTRLKAGLRLPAILNALGVSSLTADAQPEGRWERLYERALEYYPLRAEERCDSAVCHRIAFMYSLLYKHGQLNAATHEALGELFGAANMRTFEHLALMVRKGRVVGEDGDDAYVSHLERMAIPITFVHGAENVCYLPESTELTYEALQQRNGEALYRRHVVPGYGHIDCILGRNAARDVYPLVLEHLERTG
jgi:2-polyprenyl-6-methoxyphenol hydroxylase-like FAD-dependent oxidoreductase/pimeloyl-ACP methyl ester carboxylesterase